MGLFRRLIGRPKSQWDIDWQTFPGTVGDAAAVWSVDLGAVAAAPVAELPVRADVALPYAPGPDGLPVDTAVIARAEDAVRATVEQLGGQYVGHTVSAGVCRFTAQLPAPPAEPVSIPDAKLTTEYDPHWAYVRDTLAPDERQHRLLVDLAVVGVLSDHGDPLAVPRDVEHVAYFPAQDPAEDAAADLRADGFAASVERDDEGGYALTALRRDPVAPPAVHELSWSVKEAVERRGGIYDGWSCAVVAA